MVHQAQENISERDKFIEAWRQRERSIKRIVGVLMLFGAGITLAFDQPVDQLTFVVVAALIAGGLTFIFRHPRAEDVRANLYFLALGQQSNRAVMAGLAAAYLVYLAQESARPLHMIGVVIAIGFLGWYQWRIYKINQFTNQFKRSDALVIDDVEETDNA